MVRTVKPELRLVTNVIFISGQRLCGQKLQLLKFSNIACFRLDTKEIINFYLCLKNAEKF